MTLEGGCSSKPWMQSEMITQNTRDKIVPAKLERVTSHHKHPTIIEQQATTTHQHQQPHKSPTPHITKHNTLKVGCETVSRNLDLTLPS
jgi:hypothetical protein